MLVKRNGRDQLARAREPVKLEISGDEKWRPCALDDKHFWVSSKGRVKEMTEHIELPTLEERLFGPGGEKSLSLGPVRNMVMWSPRLQGSPRDHGQV